MFVLNKLHYGTQMHFNLLNLSLYKYSSLLYLDTANSGECDIKEREKAEWWGDLTLNANTIVTGDHLYKRPSVLLAVPHIWPA